jgi:ElaB/YqjD/DUF883 family membrane-anchored ribosome-binding protein
MGIIHLFLGAIIGIAATMILLHRKNVVANSRMESSFLIAQTRNKHLEKELQVFKEKAQKAEDELENLRNLAQNLLKKAESDLTLPGTQTKVPSKGHSVGKVAVEISGER